MTAPDAMTTVLLRLENLETDVKELEKRFSEYTPEQVNSLRLQSIQDALGRIGTDIKDLRDSHKELNTKLVEQQESQSKTQIRVLVGAVTAVVTALTGVLVGYITHFFH